MGIDECVAGAAVLRQLEPIRREVWLAFRHRPDGVELLGVFDSREEAKRHVAHEFGISWTNREVADRNTWFTGGWTFEVRRTTYESTRRQRYFRVAQAGG